MAKQNPGKQQPRQNQPQLARPPAQMVQQAMSAAPTPVDVMGQFHLGDAKPLIQAIEQKRNSKVLCLQFSDTPLAPIALTMGALRPIETLLRKMGRVPKLDVFLRCSGGMTEVPWRIVSLLRESTDELGVIVADKALSGGAHIAIAADQLLMTPFSVLGSVDPTRSHPLLPKDNDGNPIPMSVQDLKHCIQFIREQLGDSYSSQNLALIVSELFKYVNPLAIGALEQSYNLSRLITEKVLKTHKVPLSDATIQNAVEWLAGKYFSHSFLISRAEAESDLGLPVVKPDADLQRMILSLEEYYANQFIARTPISGSNALASVVAFMQTTDENHVAILAVQDGSVIIDTWAKVS